MSEESGKPGTEMNEAALEGVSGGTLGPDSTTCNKAQQYCNACNHKCGYSFYRLAEYMWNKGNIGDYTHCPYYY